ncbi:MAG: tripartite tricarboxylate transporter permease, partial [Actinomycetota bacterium]
MLEGLGLALAPDSLVAITIGVLGGMLVGALPGFTATMGTALLLPLTFALPVDQGLAMLGGLYVAAMFADSVPACLVNIPGTPSAMATAFDGFPLTQKGEGQKAIVASSFSAFVGTTVGGLTFMLLTGPLAEIALRFGPPEFFWIGVFSLTIIGSIAGDSLLKGVAGGMFGM